MQFLPFALPLAARPLPASARPRGQTDAPLAGLP